MVFVRTFFILAAVASALPAQFPVDTLGRTKDSLLAMSQPEVDKYLQDALKSGLPPSAVDSLTFLALNRESTVVPALIQSLRTSLQQQDLYAGIATQLGEIIAYAATPESTTVILDLYPENPKFVGRLLWRSLSYLSARSDPFPVAYRIVESSHDGARVLASDWVEENVSRGNNYAYLSRYMLSRRNGFVTEMDILDDPFAPRIGELGRRTLRLEIDKQAMRDTASPAGKAVKP